MDNDELAAISYSIKPLNFSGNIKFTPYLDFDVRNQDANYGDMFWEETSRNVGVKKGFVCAKTKKTNFQVAVAMNYTFLLMEKINRFLLMKLIVSFMWRIILSLMLYREEHTQLTSIYRLYQVFINLIFLLQKELLIEQIKQKNMALINL